MQPTNDLGIPNGTEGWELNWSYTVAHGKKFKDVSFVHLKGISHPCMIWVSLGLTWKVRWASGHRWILKLQDIVSIVFVVGSLRWHIVTIFFNILKKLTWMKFQLLHFSPYLFVISVPLWIASRCNWGEQRKIETNVGSSSSLNEATPYYFAKPSTCANFDSDLH